VPRAGIFELLRDDVDFREGFAEDDVGSELFVEIRIVARDGNDNALEAVIHEGFDEVAAAKLAAAPISIEG